MKVPTFIDYSHVSTLHIFPNYFYKRRQVKINWNLFIDFLWKHWVLVLSWQSIFKNIELLKNRFSLCSAEVGRRSYAANYSSLPLGNKLVMTIFNTSVCSSIAKFSSLDISILHTRNMSCFCLDAKDSAY